MPSDEKQCIICGATFLHRRRKCCSDACCRQAHKRARPRRSLRERFEDKLTRGHPDECWIWRGARYSNGYGNITEDHTGGHHLLAHRVSYQIYVGVIPIGMQVMHRCDNPPCVNPYHLRPGTPSDNMRDMIHKYRHGAVTMPHRQLRGSDIAISKLTEDNVRMIRTLRQRGWRFRPIARFFGVTGRNVRLVCDRTTWAHVD